MACSQSLSLLQEKVPKRASCPHICVRCCQYATNHFVSVNAYRHGLFHIGTLYIHHFLSCFSIFEEKYKKKTWLMPSFVCLVYQFCGSVICAWPETFECIIHMQNLGKI
jgi:hypothetical protein